VLSSGEGQQSLVAEEGEQAPVRPLVATPLAAQEALWGSSGFPGPPAPC